MSGERNSNSSGIDWEERRAEASRRAERVAKRCKSPEFMYHSFLNGLMFPFQASWQGFVGMFGFNLGGIKPNHKSSSWSPFYIAGIVSGVVLVGFWLRFTTGIAIGIVNPKPLPSDITTETRAGHAIGSSVVGPVVKGTGRATTAIVNGTGKVVGATVESGIKGAETILINADASVRNEASSLNDRGDRGEEDTSFIKFKN